MYKKLIFPVLSEHFIIRFRLLMTLKKKALENTVGKGENAGNQHFLLFPKCFLLYQGEKLLFTSLPNEKILDRPKLKAFAYNNLHSFK